MVNTKRAILFYGDTKNMRQNISTYSNLHEYQEMFIVEEFHRYEVPAEYYENPEEYYRQKFKRQGFEVHLHPCYNSAY